MEFVSAACNRSTAAADWASGIDGNTVAYAADRLVALYRPQDSSRRGAYKTLRGHAKKITSVRFLRRGSGLQQVDVALATAAADQTVRIWVYDKKAEKWSQSALLDSHDSGIGCLGVSRGKHIPKTCDWLAAGTLDGKVHVYRRFDAKGEQDRVDLVQVLPSGPRRIPLCLEIAFLPNSDVPILIRGGTDQKLDLYALQNNSFVSVVSLQGHADWIRSISVCTFTATEPNKFLCDDTVTTDEEGNEKHHHALRDGDLIIASSSQDKYIRLWRLSADIESVETAEKQPEPAKTTVRVEAEGESELTEDLIDILEEANEAGEDRQLSLKAHAFSVTDSSRGDQRRRYTIMFDALLIGHEDWVNTANWQRACSLDGLYHQPMTLVSASADKSIILWRPDPSTNVWINETRMGEVGGSTLGFHGAMFSPDGTYVFSHGYNGAVNLWSLPSTPENQALNVWEPQIGIAGHFASVESLDWDPSGQFLLTVSLDQTARLYSRWNRGNESTWHEFARPQIHGYDINCMAFISKFKYASGADEKVVRLFSAPKSFLSSLAVLSGEVEPDAAALEEELPVGANVPALGLSNKAVFRGDVQKAGDAHDFRKLASFTAASSTPTALLEALKQPPYEQHLLQNTLWPEISKLYGHGYEIFALGASHDGKVLASAAKAAKAEHAQIRLWSTETWRELCAPLTSHTLTVTCIRFSPDDRYLLSVGRDRTWSVYERNSSSGVYEFKSNNPKAHSRIIWDCSWSHDGALFATASRDKTVKFWKASSKQTGWEAVHTISFDVSVTSVDFTPYSIGNSSVNYLAVGLESGKLDTLSLWQQDGAWKSEKLPSFNESDFHCDVVNCVRWSPRRDSSNVGLLATCGKDCSVRIFKLPFAHYSE
ncbi:WD40-repeat-containing domain protein [Cladochytrium replicatum]|nr:WD40-repeat-containing domain protein [Cladochytrium replicatum]